VLENEQNEDSRGEGDKNPVTELILRTACHVSWKRGYFRDRD
jgi:hypothetical protein